jgi:hypothetical protein
MPTSLPRSSKQTPPASTTDLRFWFLLALPIVGFAFAIWSLNPSAASVSSAILEVAGAGI